MKTDPLYPPKESPDPQRGSFEGQLPSRSMGLCLSFSQAAITPSHFPKAALETPRLGDPQPSVFTSLSPGDPGGSLLMTHW